MYKVGDTIKVLNNKYSKGLPRELIGQCGVIKELYTMECECCQELMVKFDNIDELVFVFDDDTDYRWFRGDLQL